MKELSLSVDEAVNYLKENVKIHDNLEISYNRIFAEGEIFLDQTHLDPTIEIDVLEIKEDLIEFTHTPQDDGEIVEVTVV